MPFTALNWDSNIHTMKFTEGEFMLQKIKEALNTMLIFDIKKFVPGQKKYVDHGFSIFPLFDTLDTDEMASTTEYYINSGIY